MVVFAKQDTILKLVNNKSKLYIILHTKGNPRKFGDWFPSYQYSTKNWSRETFGVCFDQLLIIMHFNKADDNFDYYH